MANKDTRLPSKLGQAPVGSPRTLESRKKLASLFGSYLAPQSSSPRPLASSSRLRSVVNSEENASPHPGPSKRAGGAGQGGGIWNWMPSALKSSSTPLQDSGIGDDYRVILDEAEKLSVDDAPWPFIYELPDDLLIQIFSFLPPTASQLCTLSLVSRRFAYLSHSPILWSTLFDSVRGWSISPEARRRAVATRDPPPGEWDVSAWRWDREEGPDYLCRPRPRESYIPPDDPWTDDSTYSGVPSDDSSSHSNSPPNSPPDTNPHSSESSKKTLVHYPTLCRSRWVLSHHIREPSIDHPTHKATLIKHTDSVYCVIIRGDWMISGSRDRSIRIWRLGEIGEEGEVGPTKCVRHTPNAHFGSVLSLDLELKGDKGTLVSGSSDCLGSVWDIDFAPLDSKRPTVTKVTDLRGHSGGILSVILGKDRIVTASKDASIRIWKRDSSWECLHVLHHNGSVNGLALSPCGDAFVSVSGDSSLVRWIPEKGEQEWRVETGAVLACVSWKGNVIVTGDSNRSVKLWSALTGELMRTFSGHTDLVRAVGINEKEGIVVSGSYDRSLRLWDIHTAELIRRFAPHHSSQIFDLDVTTTRLASASHDNSIQLLTFGTGLPYLSLFD